MCGFAGVIAWDEQFRVSRETLARLSARVAHRGPDGEGLYLNHDDAPAPTRPQAGLVHRRLAILDPDPRANQPFTDGAGRWLAFNGEIYNFLQLRAELTRLRPQYAWRTSCDTEVLLLAYDVWGEPCCERLDGMFAFAVWDEPRQKLFIARDRMGQKPLYVATASAGSAKSSADAAGELGAIAFASELSALAELPWIDRTIDADALADYLRYGYVPSPRTIYRGVAKLPPAHAMSGGRGGRRLQHYFDPNAATPSEAAGPSSTIDSVRQTRELVRQAVQRQLVSDVPLGCFLSGGVDSSVIAAAMRAAAAPRGQEILTFSIGFDDPRYDETAHAAAVARHLGTTHRQFTVKPDAAADLPRLAAVFGEPMADSSALPTHYLARETRRHVKVALSGDGGDELFGGYDRYRAVAATQRIQRLPSCVRAALASAAVQRLPGTHPKSRTTRLKRLAATLDRPPAQRYASYLRLFDDASLAALLPGTSSGNDQYLAETYERLRATRDPVSAALATDRVTYLPEDLLTKVDRAAMLHALEVRSPFMDHELVTFAAARPAGELLGGGPKPLLRRAFAADLPPEVFRRKKMGFAVPIGDWFRAGLRPMLRDSLTAADSFARSHFDPGVVNRLLNEHADQRADHSQRLYALLMLELWWQSERSRG